MRTDDKLFLLSSMAHAPAAYAAELAGLSAAAVTWKPSDREWSLGEVVAHLADSEEISLDDRLRRILAEDCPAIPAYDQDAYAAERNYNAQDTLENLARFARANAAIVTLAWSVPDAAWDRVGLHSEAGPLTFRHMLLRIGKHHHSHLYQVRRVKYQLLQADRSFERAAGLSDTEKSP